MCQLLCLCVCVCLCPYAYESVSECVLVLVCVCVFAYALQNQLTSIFSVSIYSNRATSVWHSFSYDFHLIKLETFSGIESSCSQNDLKWMLENTKRQDKLLRSFVWSFKDISLFFPLLFNDSLKLVFLLSTLSLSLSLLLLLSLSLLF